MTLATSCYVNAVYLIKVVKSGAADLILSLFCSTTVQPSDAISAIGSCLIWLSRREITRTQVFADRMFWLAKGNIVSIMLSPTRLSSFRQSRLFSKAFFMLHSAFSHKHWHLSLGIHERYQLTFDWHFSTLTQSEIRVHWWTHNSKNPTNCGRREFNSTLHQSPRGFAARVAFATKTKALARAKSRQKRRLNLFYSM